MKGHAGIRSLGQRLAVIALAAAAILPAAVSVGATCADIDKFYWIDDRIARQLENIVNDARKKRLQVEVTSFS